MPDDKSTSDIRERVRIAAAEDYEIDYLVVKSGISREQARGLIMQHGNNREALIKYARKLF